MNAMKIEIFSRRTLRGKRWFFRIIAKNGEVVAQSEAYKRFSDAEDTVYRIVYGARAATVVTL